MRYKNISLFTILITLTSFAQSESTIHQVIVLGNIADVKEHGDFIEKLELYISSVDTRIKKSTEGIKRAKSIGDRNTHLQKIRKLYLFINVIFL